MFTTALRGHSVYTPKATVTNAELVVAFNAHTDWFNAENADAITAGTIDAKPQSSADFIIAASEIEQRYVLDRDGILDPTRMYPSLPAHPDDALGYMAKIGLDAAQKAMNEAELQGADIDLVICAASNMERAYPAKGLKFNSF